MKVCVAQTDCRVGDWRANLQTVAGITRRHAESDLIVFPELMVTGYSVFPTLGKLCEHYAEWLVTLQELGERYGTALMVGLPERCATGFFNSVVVIDGKGRHAGTYRKTHLYGGEKQAFKAGGKLETVDVDTTSRRRRLGLQICYDVEFPEVSRVLSARGADLLCVSSANMQPWCRHHRIYTRARAMENQVFVLVSNRVGIEGSLEFCGESAILGPGGEALAFAPRGVETVLTATLEPSMMSRMRNSDIGYWRDRRPELYDS